MTRENPKTDQELSDDETFRAGVRRGLEQADRGEFVDDEEMKLRIAKLLERK
jgi:predicted transcriptional regulator